MPIKPERFKQMVEEQRQQFGGKCQRCGSKTNLEFAHRLHTHLTGTRGRGSRHRYYDVKYHPKSYQLLCHECHTRLDRQRETAGYKYPSKDVSWDLLTEIDKMYYDDGTGYDE